ncbi:MAG: M3 family oligoendopeptidase [Anaerolineae bacterium]|nr:M3 family oligoendopeptidase [Anaerolineae bacterium]
MPDDDEKKVTGAENVAWNLTDLYAGIDDPALDADLDAAFARAGKLAETYKGRIAGLSAAELCAMVAEYEAIYELAAKTGSFAWLHWTTNTEDPARGALLQKTLERSAKLQQALVFVELEWANAPDEKAKALIDDPALAHYRHWLETTRLYRPHLLSEPEEKILTEKSVTGKSAWARFFEETHAATRYDWEGAKAPLDVLLSKLQEADREVRIRAHASLTAGFREMLRANTFVFNTLLADKASDDRLRSYPTWISSRNLDNEVGDAAVQALIDAVTARYDIVARYYNLKKKLLGVDELFDYDRYAPLPAADRAYTWDEARAIVIDAYGGFHPRMAETAGYFFDKSWIDASLRPGKQGGAYSDNVVPSVHPYVFMNYQGKIDDVMTLAHELGHGVHQYLARKQGMLQADTPLTTAETASIFGEMLVFRKLLAGQDDPAVRLAMCIDRIEDSFATIFRQVAMNRFEDAVHNARRTSGELTAEQFSAFWLKTQRDMFIDSVTMTEEYGLWWSYIPHFIEVPGYVYAYSFGELLVLALYARYLEAGDGFADAYLNMLAMGGSDWPHEIVKPLGVDLTDPGFWKLGLGELEKMVDEAERLAAGQIG